MFGGGANGGVPQGMQLPGQDVAAQQYQDITAQQQPIVSGVPGQVDPLYLQALQSLSNNPYSGQALTGAGQAANYGTGTLFPQQAAGATSLFGAGNQVLGTAFDPQNALYNQTLQNVQGQSNVANAQSGVQGPAAAGITDNNLNNFNLQWQNNQLQRQAQGIQAGGQAYAGGSTLGGAGIQNLASSSALPYGTFVGQNNDLTTAGNNYAGGIGNSLAPENSLASLLGAYLGIGNSDAQTALASNQQAFNQGQTIGSNTGSALNSLSNNQALANLFSGGGGGGGSLSALGASQLNDASNADALSASFGSFGL